MAQHVEIRASGSGQEPLADATGLKVKVVDNTTGLAVSYGFTPVVELTTAAGLLVKTGAGIIGDITCTKSGSGNSLLVYDGTSVSGTLLTTIVSPTVGMKFCELWKFGVGLYIVQSGGTPGSFAPSVQ